jgi:TatD DNase family protein
LELLLEHSILNAIFHWYSGPLGVLDRILAAGFYLSVGPAMIQSAKGRRIIARLPRDRVLVETDGPFVSVAGRPAVPTDAGVVYGALSQEWASPRSELTRLLWHNFSALCSRLEPLT